MKEAYRIIKNTDKEYPEKLKNHPMMPPLLYVKGSLPDPRAKTVAIVGARKCSSYGEQTAAHFARVLAENNVQIVSGLALGIDSAAHRGCLEAGGRTFAVMGCGIEHIYPASNTRLYRRMLENGGGVISEFEPSSPPLAYHFPIRNRIISALSDAVIIVEAELKSGSLITASYALDQGIPLYAVPGKISDTLSSGTNDLIWQGASPAVSASQLLADLGISSHKKEKEEQTSSLDKTHYSNDELKLLTILSSNTLSMDDLCRLGNMSPSHVSGILMSLELKGSVYSPFPGSYARTYR
jgi:DNA processing protein